MRAWACERTEGRMHGYTFCRFTFGFTWAAGGATAWDKPEAGAPKQLSRTCHPRPRRIRGLVDGLPAGWMDGRTVGGMERGTLLKYWSNEMRPAWTSFNNWCTVEKSTTETKSPLLESVGKCLCFFVWGPLAAAPLLCILCFFVWRPLAAAPLTGASPDT